MLIQRNIIITTGYLNRPIAQKGEEQLREKPISHKCTDMKKVPQHGFFPTETLNTPCNYPIPRTHIPSSPEHLHLILEGLGLLSSRLSHLEHFHSYITMPTTPKHSAKRACPDPLQQLYLTGWHLPVIAWVPIPQAFLWVRRVASEGPTHNPQSWHLDCGGPQGFPMAYHFFLFICQGLPLSLLWRWLGMWRFPSRGHTSWARATPGSSITTSTSSCGCTEYYEWKQVGWWGRESSGYRQG